MVLQPSKPITYFEVKDPFNPISYLKSPMGIMVCVSVGLYFLMKMMPKPDKEMMEEMNKMGGGMKTFQNIMKGA